MKFFKRSTSPRPESSANRKLNEKIGDAADDGPQDRSGSSSRASAGSGGSWERWKPTPGGRVMSLPRRESDRASYNRRNLFEVKAHNGARAVMKWEPPGDLLQGLSGAAAAEAAEVSGPDEAESAVSNGSSGASSSMAATQQQHRRRQRRSRGPKRRRVLASIRIIKGTDGFGFTVMTARHGQKVNSIIEEDRCAGLRRGDLLLSINGTDLAGLGHEEIVSLLRLCPEGIAAELIVRRRESAAATETAEKILNGRDRVHEAPNGFREQLVKNGGWNTSPLAGTTGSAASGDVPPVPARHYRLAAPVDAPLDVVKTAGTHTDRVSASMRHSAAPTVEAAAAVASGAAAAAAALTARVNPSVNAEGDGDGDAAVTTSSSQADQLNGMRRSRDETFAVFNGRPQHQAPLASLPPRQPVEPLWRWQQWYQQQQRQRQSGTQLQCDPQQQRTRSAQPLLPEGTRVTTLDELQQRYFRQWKQAQLTSGDAHRPATAAAAADAVSTEIGVNRWTESVVVIGDDGVTADAPPPLPPRPWRRVQSLGTLQKQQPEPQQQHELDKSQADRSTVVPPAAAVNSSTVNKASTVAPWEAASRSGRTLGSANLLQPPAVGRPSRKQEQEHHMQSFSSQPTAAAALSRRSGSISPVRSATAARARQDDSPSGDVRSRNLRLLRSLALSAPSLQQSAAGAFHSGASDGHTVPHFATLGRRPAKPNSLRVGQSTDGSASGSSSGQGAARQDLRPMANVQATGAPSAASPTAAATWDRRSSRSRTPDGTFWRRTRHLPELRRSDETDDGLATGRAAHDAQTARPVSSASASHRRRGGISMGTAAAAAAASASLAPMHAENGRPQSESADAGNAATKSSVSPQHVGTADAATVAAATTSCSPPSQRRMLPLPPPTSADVAAIERQVPATSSIVATASPATGTAAAAAAATGRSELTQQQQQQQQQSIPVSRVQPVEIDVTIYRQESGFGFCVVGGPEGGTQVTVGRIAPGGAADLEGTLRPGDEILAVDGVPTQGASHYRVIQLMGNAASRSKVDLRVRRRMLIQAAQHPTWADGAADHVDLQQTPRAPVTVSQHLPYPALHRQSSATVPTAFSSSTAQHTQPWSVSAPFTSADDSCHLAAISSCSITLTQQVGEEGFGIVIVTPRQQPNERLAEVKIGQIHPNSPAARCGRLFVGDRILSINGVPVSGLAHDAVVALIKERGRTVAIAVAAGEPAMTVSPAVAVSQETGERLLVNRYDMATGTDNHHSRAPASFDATASAGEELNRQDSFLEVSAVPCVGQSCPDTPELSAAGRGGRLHADLGTNAYGALCDDDRDLVPCSPAYEGAGVEKGSLHRVSGSKLETPPHRPVVQRFQAAAAARSDISTRAAAGAGSSSAPYWPSSSMSLRFGGSYCQLDSVDSAVAASHSVPPHDNLHTEPWSPTSTRGPLVRSTTLPLSQPIAAAAVPAVPSATNVQHPPKVFTVDLTQDGKGFGFSVRGGHEFGAAPLCVLRLAPGGAADRCGKLQVGDEILAINGRPTAGVRHADAIGMIQDAGRAVRLTVQRGGDHVDATSMALPHRDHSAVDEAAEAGEGGSPRSSPTGSSANGSNGGVNAEKWWNNGGQQPQSAASAAALRFGQAPVGSDRTRSATDLAEVDDWNVRLTPKSAGGGLLMQAPLWRPSHHTLPAFSGQQQQQLVESPSLSAGDKVRGSRTFGGAPVSCNASVVTDGVQRPRSLCTGVSTVTSSYMSPGTTGSLRVIAELDPSHLSGRYSVAEATAIGRGVPAATAPFGFYETLLRQT